MSDWKPIGTAPQADGFFLAASKDMVHIVCRVNGDLFDVGGQPETGRIGFYPPAYQLTHWMAFPDPPVEEIQKSPGS